MMHSDTLTGFMNYKSQFNSVVWHGLPSICSFVDMTEIYVADSESSSIRALDLKTGGSRLLAGGDPVFSDNLFKVILFWS